MRSLPRSVEVAVTRNAAVPAVRVEPAQFSELVAALVSNAREAMPHGIAPRRLRSRFQTLQRKQSRRRQVAVAVLVDTAGVRRKSRVTTAVETASVLRAIRAVGNYGESFDRHLGKSSPRSAQHVR